MKQLTIKELAPYLPYGLKVCAMGETVDDDDKPKVFEMVGLDTNFVEFHEIGRSVTEQYIYSDIFPILRRLSDLTKEIEHNGEKFVPIEFFEIGDDDNYSFEFDSGNIILIKTLKSISKFNNWHDINFLPYAVAQQLMEWHFDIFGLIENGLAIDINTLK